MPLPGSCQICHGISKALSICTYCGKRVCVNCIDLKTRKCSNCEKK